MSEPESLRPLSARLPGCRVAGLAAVSAALLLATLLVWAALTEIDVVTTAPALARTGAGTATVRSPATGTVARAFVAEGAVVQRGEPVARLESALADAHWRSARTMLASSRRALAEARGVLAGLGGGGDVTAMPAPVRLRVEAQRRRLAQLDGQAEVLRTELRLAREQLATAAQVSRIAADRHRAVRRAGELGAISRFDVHGAELALRTRQGELEAARGRVRAFEQRLEVQRDAAVAARLEFREALLEQVAALEVEVAERVARLAEAAEQRRRSAIVAPVGGVVDRLLVGSGDFLERGEPVAAIVPDPATVYFEVRLASAQMAFLRAGLPCRIKLDALPFPRYGALPCTLTRLGNDVVSGKHGGRHYLARVEPAAQALLADGTSVRLRPGASGWVDVVAGRRTVLGYVTEPLQRFARESLRER